jgi:hypothetical protein
MEVIMKLPRLTPSNVADLACAKKFSTLRIRNEWPPRKDNGFNLNQEFGTAVHEVLRNLYDPNNSPVPNLTHMDAITQSAFFARGYPDETIREEEIERCKQIVTSYVVRDFEAEGTVDVERQSEFAIHHGGKPLFLLSAKMDRVVVRPSYPETLVVKDYKCGKRHLNLEEAFILLWAAKLQYPNYKRHHLELEWLCINNVYQVDVITPFMLRGLYSKIKDRALKIFQSDDYPAEPGETCCWCPLKSVCQPRSTESFSLDTADELFEHELE